MLVYVPYESVNFRLRCSIRSQLRFYFFIDGEEMSFHFGTVWSLLRVGYYPARSPCGTQDNHAAIIT